MLLSSTITMVDLHVRDLNKEMAISNIFKQPFSKEFYIENA